MTIGQVGERLGINPRTIRYYERIELLPEPERTGGGYRIYSRADEDRIRFIKNAQRLGFSLGEVKETLAFRERGELPCAYVAGVIEARLHEVGRRLSELRAFERELSELHQRIGGRGAADDGASDYCHYIESAGR